MTITVFIEYITDIEIKQIIEFYNFHKQSDEEPLEELDRCEGGFQIKISDLKDIDCDTNKKIKQLRWNKRQLISEGYIGFTEYEEKLLYTSMVQILGSKNVLFE